ncbi:MAG TPA: N-acetylmuramoyl-L-alanine amidase [Syntrophomonadaceae bacterium]|nr:N-acetylmuramoyl-L-alanine amidase [Syntrophomonadaceae bacterium]
MINIIPTNLTFGPLSPRPATRRIIVHHSASPDVSAAAIHGWHLQRGWSGIGYHFVIRQDGSIEAGRPVDSIGAHAGPPANGDSIGICLAGNFMEYPPASLQLQSLVQLVAYLQEAYKTDLEVLRHKDVASTECPGDLFPWLEIIGALYGPSIGENEGGNTVEPWKNDIMTQAMDKKLITQEHDPDEPAPKWFVLAVALNTLQEVESHGEKQ